MRAAGPETRGTEANLKFRRKNVENIQRLKRPYLVSVSEIQSNSFDSGFIYFSSTRHCLKGTEGRENLVVFLLKKKNQTLSMVSLSATFSHCQTICCIYLSSLCSCSLAVVFDSPFKQQQLAGDQLLFDLPPRRCLSVINASSENRKSPMA